MNITIENTNITEYRNEEGELKAFRINPADGYKLHIKSRDMAKIDELTGEETGEIELGFTRTFVQVNANYDFEANPFEIYATEDTVEEDAL